MLFDCLSSYALSLITTTREAGALTKDAAATGKRAAVTARPPGEDACSAVQEGGGAPGWDRAGPCGTHTQDQEPEERKAGSSLSRLLIVTVGPPVGDEAKRQREPCWALEPSQTGDVGHGRQTGAPASQPHCPPQPSAPGFFGTDARNRNSQMWALAPCRGGPGGALAAPAPPQAVLPAAPHGLGHTSKHSLPVIFS